MRINLGLFDCCTLTGKSSDLKTLVLATDVVSNDLQN